MVEHNGPEPAGVARHDLEDAEVMAYYELLRVGGLTRAEAAARLDDMGCVPRRGGLRVYLLPGRG